MRIRKLTVMALAWALAVSFSLAAAERIDLDQLRIPYSSFVLENGLTVIVHSDHSVPIVAVNLWYHVGSRNERRGRTGFAHLFEHFFFNGSENYPHGFREAMDDVGANNRNGTTNTDRTNFFEDVPVSALERTLYLEADRLGFLAGHISQEMLDRERGVVQNEKRQGENQPYGKVYGRITESIYPYSHPYSWTTIGSMDDLEAATLEDIREWYRSYYGPNNCVLSLAGDITEGAARELVGKYFGSIPPGPPVPQYRQWVPAFERNLRDLMPDRVPQTRIYRVYHVPGWGTPDAQRLKLAASVLSGSKSARLDRRLVYDKQLATSVSAYVSDDEIAGSLMVVITVKAGVDPAEAEAEMDAVLDELLASGPNPEELDRAKTRFVAGFIRGIERLGGFGGRSDVLAKSATYGGDPDAYLDHFEVMVRSTPEQVSAVCRAWLDAHHYTMTVVPFPELAAGESSVDRSVLPGLGDPPEVRFPEVQRLRLANGLELLLLERHGAPMVELTLAVDAGYAADPPNAPGTASLALQLMEEGTATRDAFQIVDELDALGAQLSGGNTLDLSMVSLQALTMNLSESLDVFADVVLNPAFPGDKVELGKRRRIAQIGQEKAQPIGLAIRIAPRLIYGEGHAYANPLTGSGFEESVRGLSREDLASWHQAWFHPNNATLIVAGDVSMKALSAEVERAFGPWTSGEAPTKNVARVDVTTAGRIFVIDKQDAPQSLIVAAHVSEAGGRSDELAIETFMRAFGGMATSRLNRNLRLDKHWSYGVFGLLLDARGQRPFIVIGPVQTDKTTEAMIEIKGEIEAIAGTRPIRDDEFESIKRNMVLRLPGRFETLSSLESAAVDLVNFGLSPEYFYDYASNVRRLTEEDLARAAAECVHPENLIWIVVGDMKKIEQELRDLGFGELVRLNPDGLPLE